MADENQMMETRLLVSSADIINLGEKQIRLRFPADPAKLLNQPLDFDFPKTSQTGRSLVELSKLAATPAGKSKPEYLISLTYSCEKFITDFSRPSCEYRGNEFIRIIPPAEKIKPVTYLSSKEYEIKPASFMDNVKQNLTSVAKEKMNWTEFIGTTIRDIF